MSKPHRDADDPGSGARTLGAGVFLILAGISIALMMVSVPLGAAALALSVGAGVLAARHRTAEVGLPGGAVDAEARLEGFIVDPAVLPEADVFTHQAEPHQVWSDSIDASRHPHHDDELAEYVEPPPAPVRHEPWAPSTEAPPSPDPSPLLFDAPRPADTPLDRGHEREREAIESLGPPLVPPEAYGQAEPILHDAEAAALDLDLAALEPLEEELERDRQVGHLRAVHAEAAEQLNVAIARWHQLVGDDADPYDPEPVIRAHDPQLAFDPRQIEASPTVRTVASYHRTTQAQWRVLWASLGAEEVPDPEAVDEVLDSMLAPTTDAAAELARLEAAEARRNARTVLDRPLVMVEPEGWVSAARLDQLLASLPAETDVVVVERAS